MRMTTFFLCLVAAPLVLGCQDPITEIDESVDCNDVCNRYQSCYDSSYDTAACRDRCEALVDADGGRPHAADDCDACMDDSSCLAAVFDCSVECAGIVP